MVERISARTAGFPRAAGCSKEKCWCSARGSDSPRRMAPPSFRLAELLEEFVVHGFSIGRADNPNQATRGIRVGNERGVDAFGECLRIRIVTGADDDSGMGSLGVLMKTDEVDPVQRENRAVL